MTTFFVKTTDAEGAELWATDGTPGGAYLVRDLAPGPASSFPSDLFNFNGVMYFNATDGVGGNELWRTDGTAGGTVLVKDINPGAGDTIFSDFTAVGSTLYFSADDGAHGKELWKTDGTAAGTTLVADIDSRPVDTFDGTGSSEPSNLTNVNGTLYFEAFAPSGDFSIGAIYKTDGTAAGTVRLTADGVYASGATFTVNGKFLFSASDDSTNTELWATDGTTAGTVKLTPTGVHVAGPEIVFNDDLLFRGSDNQLWITDGTTAGTHLLGGGANGVPAFPRNFVPYKGEVYFYGYNSTYGAEIWKTDGTVAGTVLFKDLNSGGVSSNPDDLIVLGDKLIFRAYAAPNRDFAGQAQAGYEIWVSDGTTAGTMVLKDINPGAADAFDPNRAANFTKVGDKVFFVADDGTHGRELWVTDGTATGTKLVKDISSGTASSDPSQFTVAGGKLYFIADDGSHGRELWATDGTAAGTALLKDIAPGTASSDPFHFTVSDGKLYFEAFNGTAYEMFVTDGTAAGTASLGQTEPLSDATDRTSLIDVGGTLYFRATDDLHGQGLWTSNGTSAGTQFAGLLADGLGFTENLVAVGSTVYSQGYSASAGFELWKSTGGTTQLVKDINPTGDSTPQELTAVGGKLFFAADDGVHGNELWVSDGTSAGTVLVKDIYAGATESIDSAHRFSNYYSFTALGSKLMFVADDGTHGRELWTSDGTAAGTVMVKDIMSGAGGSNISDLTTVGSTLYFSASDGVSGQELWKSNGTAAGTVLVSNLDGGAGDSSPGNLTAVGSTLFFTSSAGGHGDELWKSNGTAAGTVLVKDVNQQGSGGSFSSYITEITAVGTKAFFTAVDGLHGRELWVSNGTANGTTLVKDINAGTTTNPDDPYPQSLTAVGSTLFFVADDGTHGEELWKSDGTAAGTTMVKDILLGSADTTFGDLVASNGKLFFAANDQLWMSDGTAAGTVMVANTLVGTQFANGVGADPNTGTPNDDTLVATAAAQNFKGLAGFDVVTFASAPAAVTASLVDPSINTGYAAGDTYSSIEGFIGSNFNDKLTGDGAANRLDGGAGADTLTGGAGNDTYYVDAAGDKVVEALNQGTDTVHATVASYTLTDNVERLYFDNTGNHTAKGNALSNLIYGNAGLDKFLIDSGGNDTFSGGGGEDTFDGRAATTGMVLRLDAQANNAGSVAGDTFAAIEKFFGSDTAADQMTTGAARAKFFGYGGNDTLIGGSSIDALSGGAGNDSLVGNGGQDALDGGVGNDTMTGGAGKDTFTFVDAAFGKDVITDFEDGIDRLKVFSAVADSFSDFTIAGNGTHHVVLTLVGATANTITLDNASANITVSAADFLFY